MILTQKLHNPASIRIWMLVGILFLSTKTYADTQLIVNEVQVANLDQYIDPSYDYGGWIELYNPTNSDISLNNWFISDDINNLKLFHMSSAQGSVPAKGYKNLWFDHNSADGNYGDNAKLQMRMKLDSEGGTIYISDSNGNLVLTQTYPAAVSRCSYARTTDGGSTWKWTAYPTPEATNTTSTFADTQLEAPVVDHDGCLFTSSFNVNVTIPEGCTLKFTTDGSTPTFTNGTISTTGSFPISTTKVYRFRLFRDGYLPSDVVTRSYIYKDKNYYLPIVSVVTDNKNLYDNTIGVYCVGTNGIIDKGINYKSNKNMDWDRPVNFEYFTADGKSVLSQETDFCISGGWSRHWLPTSFKLKADKQYGTSSLNYPFFSAKPYVKNKAVIMRNGGNDTGCRVKDALVQQLIQSAGVYLDGQAYNPCHVFLNGTYLAMLNMREANNKFFGYSNYGLDTDEMDAFEMDASSSSMKVKAGTINFFSTLLSKASSCASESVYQTIINEYLDIDEYINYMAAECYIGSSDWLTNNNNCKGFRSWNGGKYHFVMFDTDAAFDYNNMLSMIKGSSQNNLILLFNRLRQNATFQKQFVTAYCLMNGSVFTNERTESIADEMGDYVQNALALDSQSPTWSLSDFKTKIESTSNRTIRMNTLKSVFSLATGNTLQINANIEDAVLSVNDQKIPTNKFEGILYPPYTISATAPAGYNFTGWKEGFTFSKSLLASNSTWSYYDKGSLDGTDWKTGDVSTWATGNAPLGYAKDGLGTTISYGGNANNKYPTYYFRKTFTVDELPSAADKVMLNYTVDDGCIIYINGTEVGRHLMNSGDAKYSDYATSYTSGNPDTGSFTLDPSILKKGENIIAAEVHNNASTSSDIYWNASITVVTNTGKINSTERSITVSSSQSEKVYTAMFEKLPDEYLIEAGQTPVMVNEVSAANEIYINDYYKRNDWVELYNTTSNDIDLSGMYLSDNPDKTHKYQIPEGNIIKAHGYKVIWADKLDPLYQLHSGFKLGNEDGECVILTAADDSWSNTLTYTAHAGNETVGRYPDGGNRIYRMTLPTIEKANQLTTYATWISGEDKNFDTGDNIASVKAENEQTQYYTIDGVRLNQPQRGLNIIRQSNGVVRKVIIK